MCKLKTVRCRKDVHNQMYDDKECASKRGKSEMMICDSLKMCKHLFESLKHS